VFYVPNQPTEGGAMNDNGLRVGTYYDSAGHAHGFESSSWTQYRGMDYYDGAETFISSADNSGNLVGYSYGDFSRTQPFGVFFDVRFGYRTIGHPEGVLGTRLTGINNNLDMVGWYIDANGRHHGFINRFGLAIPRWRGAFATIDFPGATLTELNGINDQGQVVGRYVIGISPSSPGYETGGFVAAP